MIRQPGQGRNEGTARKEKPEQDGQNKKASIGKLE
jgi:hypothetical protein